MSVADECICDVASRGAFAYAALAVHDAEIVIPRIRAAPRAWRACNFVVHRGSPAPFHPATSLNRCCSIARCARDFLPTAVRRTLVPTFGRDVAGGDEKYQ